MLPRGGRITSALSPQLQEKGSEATPFCFLKRTQSGCHQLNGWGQKSLKRPQKCGRPDGSTWFSAFFLGPRGEFHEGHRFTMGQAGTLMSRLFQNHHRRLPDFKINIQQEVARMLNIKLVLLAAVPYLASPQFQLNARKILYVFQSSNSVFHTIWLALMPAFLLVNIWPPPVTLNLVTILTRHDIQDPEISISQVLITTSAELQYYLCEILH